jgi:hypothetical protein
VSALSPTANLHDAPAQACDSTRRVGPGGRCVVRLLKQKLIEQLKKSGIFPKSVLISRSLLIGARLFDG